MMTIASSTDLITTLTGQVGVGVFVVLGVVMSLAIAYLVFKFGWKKLEQSLVDNPNRYIAMIMNREYISSQDWDDLVVEYQERYDDN